MFIVKIERLNCDVTQLDDSHYGDVISSSYDVAASKLRHCRAVMLRFVAARLLSIVRIVILMPLKIARFADVPVGARFKITARFFEKSCDRYAVMLRDERGTVPTDATQIAFDSDQEVEHLHCRESS